MMNKIQLLFVLACAGFIVACSETTFTDELPLPEAPANPFDGIDYSENEIPPIEVDSSTFLGLHEYIFSKSCNQPGCHDGTFEPEFPTVQSAYNSLVYHPIIKNYATDPLQYRVQPGDPDASMLWHRLTIHNPPNFEQMPSSGNPLAQRELDLIREWIEAGAPDIYGNLPVLSSVQPTCYGVAAFLPDFGNYRIDTVRGGVIVNPFMAPTSEDVSLWFLYTDVTAAGDTIFGNELMHNMIKFSTDPYDFSDAVELQMELVIFPNLIPSVFSQFSGIPYPHYHNIVVNFEDLGFSPGEIVYMRTYVQDDDHDTPTEIPTSNNEIFILTYFSCVLQ
jgi:hypothetical protein